MSISVEYVRYLMEQGYRISREEICSRAERNCAVIVETLKGSIRERSKQSKQGGNGDNQVYPYLLKVKKTADYARIIRYLRELDDLLKEKQILTEAEKKNIETLDSYFSKELKMVGFSASSIGRILDKEKQLDEKMQQRLECIFEYVFIPGAVKDQSIRTQFFIATRKFLIEKKMDAEKTPYRDGYRALIFDAGEFPEDCEQYMRSAFDMIIMIDHFLDAQQPYENEIKNVLGPIVERACNNCRCIESAVITEIWAKAIPELVKEVELYENICGARDKIFESPYFKSISLYHISHIFLTYREEDIEYERVALKLFSYAASKFEIVLHPESMIYAPCGLLGDHIFVGAGSVIGEGCYIEENVVIAGCPNRAKSSEDDNTMVRIGGGTTIKKGAILVAGVTVGAQCIIGQDVVLIKRDLDDCQMVEGAYSPLDIWNHEEYLQHGGHDYGR